MRWTPKGSSLGQDDGYYEGLQALGPTARTQILTALCDVAYSPTLLEGAMGEEVLNRSLLRSVTLTTVVAQFHRIAHGGARLTPFRFTFDAPTGGTDTEPSVRLRFDVTPESTPPTNIHALIGSNGVGKTHLLRAFARAAVGLGDGTGGVVTNIADDEQLFTNMVSVSFSAFDPFTAVEPDSVVPHTYVSLSQEPSGEMENSTPIFKEPHQLANEYVEVLADLNGELLRRWITALETMGFDSLVYLIKPFAMGEAPYNPDSIEIGEALKAADRTSMARSFSRMSSGHKIVLLAITHLVRRVTERSLVLIDEPETHLHPPLLSAFIRAVSDLLTNRNGVAIIATHSPVVLQETPAPAYRCYAAPGPRSWQIDRMWRPSGRTSACSHVRSSAWRSPAQAFTASWKRPWPGAWTTSRSLTGLAGSSAVRHAPCSAP